jgi:hypothetical protein
MKWAADLSGAFDRIGCIDNSGTNVVCFPLLGLIEIDE